MRSRLAIVFLCALAAYPVAMGAEAAAWWNPRWRLRTTVQQPVPYRDDAPRPVEVAVDFPLLLKGAGIAGEFDPASLRVIERGREVPFAYRTELDPAAARKRPYLAWIARPKITRRGMADIYFDTTGRGIKAPGYDVKLLPPDNLLKNPGFEDKTAGWKVTPTELVRFGRFDHTNGERSLKIVVNEKTPKDARREVSISQRIDVRKFAGQEMAFECDLMAERAAYGAPVCIELQQFREDGSRILEYAVQPRWLTIELAEGQLVQFRERGTFSHEAATVNVRIRIRCHVRDADTRQTVPGPESFFTVWLDRLVARPGERWSWPAASDRGFVAGALKDAPVNRAFEFTGQRRLAFNGASEGTLTARTYNHAKSVHWGLQGGTLEFWCRPSWDADDGAEHVFFHGVAYGHRLQSRLRKLGADGKNHLEFSIADAGGTRRTVRGPAALRRGRWHHIAATWDFPRAHLQLFVDGKRVAAQGPGKRPWPSSLVAVDKKKKKGIGISQEDRRSMPMQAFIGGDKSCRKDLAAEAVIDEFRISDVARYTKDFAPPRAEFKVDEHTRVLFHFENERDGVHDSDDRFVRGHLACELPPQLERVALDIFKDGKIEHRMVVVEPHPSRELFEANRAENRLTVTRPLRKLPDPRFIEHRERQVERTVTGKDDEFVLKVGGDYEPLMRSVTFQHAKGAPLKTTLLPRWRANDNVVPFSAKDIAATLAPDAANDAERAFEAFKYALALTNYFDAHYCETVPSGRHRPRISYTLLKHLNIYPFDQCGPLNYTLRKLFLAVGISSNDASGTHHQFEQAFYGGRWRLFDLSPRLYWLNRDNATVVGRRGIEEDPYLKLRQGGNVCAWLRGRRSRARFGVAERPHRMDFPLRPGERVSFCWHNEGRWFELTGDRKPIPLAKIPPYFGNGAIVYELTAKGDAAVLDNAVVASSRVRGIPIPVLRAREPARPATLIYRAHCPYIFSDARVTGFYKAKEAGAVSLSLSFDQGKTWSEVWRSATEVGQIGVDLLAQVTGRYTYWLKLELAPGQSALVTPLKVRTTFVVSPLALPGKLRRGENRIRFVGGPVSVPVKSICRWVERHKSNLRVSLNAISYYINGDEAHRNLFVVAPRSALSVSATLEGRRLRGTVSVEGPLGFSKRHVAVADGGKPSALSLILGPAGNARGQIQPFDVVVGEGARERRVPAQALVADAPLVREGEHADEISDNIAATVLPEASGARVMAFTGDGKLSFGFTASRGGKHALWLRARWRPGSSTRMTLTLDKGKPRELRAAAMIGFTDWTNRSRAHTKMFAHFGEQYGHWAWYRIPEVELTAGKHRLTLSAGAGASFDALVLLAQNPVIDRAAMNLFQNWNYAPWQNPL